MKLDNAFLQVWSEWRCPDCGMGVTKIHVTVNGLVRCGRRKDNGNDED